MDDDLITKVVLTGGPCAGKTSALTRISEHFSQRGYHVVVGPEIATLVINAGFIPAKSPGFNLSCSRVIRAMEEELITLSRALAKKTLIVFDRGVMDSKAYCSPEEWQKILAETGRGEAALRDERYDLVVHLVTAADGAAEFYTTANNTARLESPEQAVEVDRRLQAAWTGHPHFCIVSNTGNFEEKMRRTLGCIGNTLGEPEPLETERKFLLKALPDLRRHHVVSSLIRQTYLTTAAGSERVRSRQYADDAPIYTHTSKRDIPNKPSQRIEIERLLCKREYQELLGQRDHRTEDLLKNRHCFVWNHRQFEVDEFLGKHQGTVVMEVETQAADEPVALPPFVEIEREVTGDPRWSNHTLARK